jgi:hypothetical protein
MSIFDDDDDDEDEAPKASEEYTFHFQHIISKAKSHIDNYCVSVRTQPDQSTAQYSDCELFEALEN